MIVRLTGYTPFEHQKAVHAVMGDAYRCGKVYVVKSKRQVGKTTMAENIVLKMSADHAGVLSAIVEPTLDQARKVYKDILKSVQDTPFLKRKNDSLLEIEFDNGSQVIFKSAEQRDNLRGFTITGILIIDEAAFIMDDVYDILQPTTDVHSAPILIISTPKFRQGFFYRYYTAGMEKRNPDIVSVDFNDYDTSMLLSREKLDQYRLMMPKAQFTTEYLGQFLDTDSILFTNIKECIGVPNESRELYVGIDWGSGTGGDYTSVCAFNADRQMSLIHYFNDKSIFEQVSFICDILKGYDVKRIMAESNSIGTPMITLLKEEMVKRGMANMSRVILPFTTTNQEKVRLVNQMQVALEQKNISILNDSGLINQLSAYEATYNPKTNNVSYNAPQGLHDDNCISTMLALDALMMNNKRGHYSVSMYRGRRK